MKRLYAVLALGIVLIAGATGAQAASSSCFQQYQNDILNCTYLPYPDQTLCNLDAAVSLTGCIRRAVFG